MMILHMLLVICLLVILFYVLERILHREFHKARKQFNGPPGYWLIGSIFDFINKTSKEIFDKIQEDFTTYGRFYYVHAFGVIHLYCQDYRDAETLLSSRTQIDKGKPYRYFEPWIGHGLLTSTGEKWKKHRKMLTPTFHIKMLDQYIDVFNRNGAVMCDKMEKEVDGEPFNVYNYLNLAALDNIYEYVMGVSMNVQKKSETTYIRAIKEMCNVIHKRSLCWFLSFDLIFRFSKYCKIQQEAFNALHSEAEEIIALRKKELAIRRELEKNEDQENEAYQKKRKAFLDLLLESAEEYKLSDEDIRDEVNTFMFGGHSTISSGLSFTLWALANNPDVQQKVYQEQIEIFGDSDRTPTMNDLQNMKYLKKVLKESQRLYPSAPTITRTLNESVELLGGYYIPKGSDVSLNIYSLHRDPKIWPDPEKFNPENFAPEALHGRNPYSYIPFSSGPRSCVGQKFAMLEMKSTVSKAIRQYKLLPSPYEEHKLQLTEEVVLTSVSGFHIKIQRRN